VRTSLRKRKRRKRKIHTNLYEAQKLKKKECQSRSGSQESLNSTPSFHFTHNNIERHD
jgi:hypothetical protein